jgi:hypothetical protein
MMDWLDLDEVLSIIEGPDTSTEGEEVAEAIDIVKARLNEIKAITDTLPKGDYSGG